MTRKTRNILFIFLSAIILASFGIFSYVAFSSYRKSNRFAEAMKSMENKDYGTAKWMLRDVLRLDPENELAVRKLAKIAELEDNPPEHSQWLFRAIRLNPLDESLKSEYARALVREHALDTLQTFLADNPSVPSPTLDAAAEATERLLLEGNWSMLSNQLERAEVAFTELTATNRYIGMPRLAQAKLARGKLKEAINLYDEWTKSFRSVEITLRLGELLAIDGDEARLVELVKRTPQNSPATLVISAYFDALIAVMHGEHEKLPQTVAIARGQIKSPLASYTFLLADLQANDLVHAESDLRDLFALPPQGDLRLLAKIAVKKFVAKALKAGTPATDLKMIAEAAGADGDHDPEMDRFVELVKQAEFRKTEAVHAERMQSAREEAATRLKEQSETTK